MGYGKVKRMMALVLACLCMVGQAAVPGTANAKGVGQPSQGMISKSKLAMYPNMAAQLKVTGVNAKVTWSSTDRRIATVMGSRGKNHQAAVIRTKDKAGTCKIKAKAAGKTYTCKVTVKKDSKVSRVKLLKVKKTSGKVEVKARIYNRSGKEYYYGHPYTVEKFVKGAWKKIAPSDDMVFTSEVISIPAHSKMDVSYTVSNGVGRRLFTKGVYRLEVNVTGPGMKHNYVLFSL